MIVSCTTRKCRRILPGPIQRSVDTNHGKVAMKKANEASQWQVCIWSPLTFENHLGWYLKNLFSKREITLTELGGSVDCLYKLPSLAIEYTDFLPQHHQQCCLQNHFFVQTVLRIEFKERYSYTHIDNITTVLVGCVANEYCGLSYICTSTLCPAFIFFSNVLQLSSKKGDIYVGL